MFDRATPEYLESYLLGGGLVIRTPIRPRILGSAISGGSRWCKISFIHRRYLVGEGYVREAAEMLLEQGCFSTPIEALYRLRV